MAHLLEIPFRVMTDQCRHPCRLRASGSRWLREIALVWRGGWGRLRSRFWIILLAAATGLVLVGIGNDADMALLGKICSDGNETATQAAKFIRDYSDLVLCVPLSLILWSVGAVSGRSRWRRLGLACLMSALMAGLVVTMLKEVTGRPRPAAAQLFPGVILHGPTTRSKLHSFPSGHTATSTATGVSLVASAPIVIIPGAIYSVTVGWSRMQLRDHYPLDVAVGGIIGLVCGACFASTVPGSIIRVRRRKTARKKAA